MSEKIIETAAEFYREMKRRGLELRLDNGRDDQLHLELSQKLGFSPDQFQLSLDQSNLNAEEFLLHFLAVAKPFAQMYEDIWRYMASYQAPNAEEKLSIRFGFRSDMSAEINLEQFRRHIEVIKQIVCTIQYQYWSDTAIYLLHELKNHVLQSQKGGTRFMSAQGYYRGDYLILPVPQSGTHPMDALAVEIRNVFQAIIDDSHHLKVQGEDAYLKYEGNHPSSNAAYALSDLIPSWNGIFEYIHEIDISAKDSALMFYEKEIKPLIRKEQAQHQQQIVNQALDILDLPFWKHRWHTYEIWSTVSILKGLADYSPRLRIADGRIPLDGYASAIIADLEVNGYPDACVAVQYQTDFINGARKAIKPDLRICYNNSLSSKEATAVIVEYKQHAKIGVAYLQEILESYSEGSPEAKGVIVINYDNADIELAIPEYTFFISGVRPGNQKEVQHFQATLDKSIIRSGFKKPIYKTVLLDVSGSMNGVYGDEELINTIKLLALDSTTAIFHFADRLISPQKGDEVPRKTGGGTDIVNTLDDLDRLDIKIGKLIIVSDGDYHLPSGYSSDNLIECHPLRLHEVAKEAGWISSL